jgi:hypothetical protein
MIRLTLRTLLAYIDDTLEPNQARELGRKVAESPDAKQLIERIKKVTRRRGLHVPIPDGTEDDVSDPNTVAEYLSDNLNSDQVKELETTCLASDVHLAEVAACHQILTLVLTEPVRVPPSANQRMYRLVEPPASDHNRKPGKAVPIGGVIPSSAAPAEADDVDAPLLLGMSRYAAASSPAARFALVGAALAICVFLALAVWKALPHAQPEPLERSHDFAANVGPPVVAGPGASIAPEPRPQGMKIEPPSGDGKPPEPVVDPKKPEEPKKAPMPVLGEAVIAPLAGREVIGALDTANPMIDAIAIVVTRGPEPGSPWERIEAKAPEVRASDPVMALPGYKADVRLKSDVLVHLWGNAPEQVAMKAMVMESRVRFHPTAPGFDADLTLVAGRIYLSTVKKSGGAKVRVRFAGETWDILLPDDKSEVMVQAHTAFVPGTPYARQDGDKPRTEARLAVVRGTAAFSAPARFKKYDKLTTWSEISWDSKTGRLSQPKAIEVNDPFTVRIPLIAGELGRATQKALSDAAQKLTDRTGVRVLLEARMNYEETRDNILPTTFAIYAYAAIADGPDTPTLIANLYDQLKERGRHYARRAAVMAVSSWLPRDLGNTALFCDVMINQKLVPEEEADLIAQLLRGYSSREKGDPAAVDKLVELLDHPSLIVREAALGNLIAFFDPEAGKKPELGGLNVAARGEPGYDKALRAWKTWADEMKMMMEKKK